MRENIRDREREQSVKTVYQIKGLNLDRFINTVKRKGITMYNVKKISTKQLLVTVNLSDSEIFFAKPLNFFAK